MKAKTERKKRYSAKLHRKKKLMHVHLSKDLRAKLKGRKRAVLVRKGDKVKVMRGTHAGFAGKVARVNYNKMKVYLEGLSVKNARGTEMLLPFEPSNLILIELEATKERKETFGAAALTAEKPAPAPKAEKSEKKEETQATRAGEKV